MPLPPHNAPKFVLLINICIIPPSLLPPLFSSHSFLPAHHPLQLDMTPFPPTHTRCSIRRFACCHLPRQRLSCSPSLGQIRSLAGPIAGLTPPTRLLCRPGSSVKVVGPLHTSTPLHPQRGGNTPHTRLCCTPILRCWTSYATPVPSWRPLQRPAVWSGLPPSLQPTNPPSLPPSLPSSRPPTLSFLNTEDILILNAIFQLD